MKALTVRAMTGTILSGSSKPAVRTLCAQRKAKVAARRGVSILGGGRRGLGDSFMQGVAQFAPGFEATGEWPDAEDAPPS